MVTSNSQLLKVATIIVDFLVDTGASVTILPINFARGLHLNHTPVRLSSATGDNIPCHNETSVDIVIPGLRRLFPWTVVVANTLDPLLRADFLRHYALILGCRTGKLHDNKMEHCTTSTQVTATTQQITVNNCSQLSKPVQFLLNKYPTLFMPRRERPNTSITRIKYTTDTGNSKPTSAKARQLPEEKYKVIKQEFTALMNTGIIRR